MIPIVDTFETQTPYQTSCTYQRKANGVHWIAFRTNTYYAIKEMCQYMLYIGESFHESPSRIVIDTHAIRYLSLTTVSREMQCINELAADRVPSRVAMMMRKTSQNALIGVVVRSLMRPEDSFEVFTEPADALAWVNQKA